jgi:hypothetical protein
MQYKTDRIRGRRFLTGGVFLGPLGSEAIGTDGSLKPTARMDLRDAHGGLIDVMPLLMRLVVYGQPTRPKNAPPGTPNNKDGVAGYVQNVDVMYKPAVLRRRRD